MYLNTRPCRNGQVLTDVFEIKNKIEYNIMLINDYMAC